MEKYEKGSKPVIITGITDEWPAQKKWTYEVNFRLNVIDTERKLWQGICENRGR